METEMENRPGAPSNKKVRFAPPATSSSGGMAVAAGSNAGPLNGSEKQESCPDRISDLPDGVLVLKYSHSSCIFREEYAARKVVRESYPQPNALQRLQGLLMSATARSFFDASFAAWLKGALEDFIHKFSFAHIKVKDLTACLHSMHRLRKGHASASAFGARLAGLHGNDLFRALMALQVPVGPPPEDHLEVALAAQRLIVYDDIDKFSQIYGQIVYEDTYSAVHQATMAAYFDHMQTLAKLVQEHIHLADATPTSRPTSGPSRAQARAP
ncbi:hypothetical protein VPH35_097696 [Triticum aestivum]